SLPEVVPAKGPRKLRVGFFLGCVMNLAFAGVSRATVRVLSENGCEVVTPREQRCCGAPHESEGDEATLRALARQNIAAFQGRGIDLIVTDCAACGAALKGYAELLGDGAGEFSAKVRDIAEFLTETPLEGELRPLPYRVAYHEPCHLVHAQKVSAQPKALLRAIPGLKLVELPEATWCCGSAGSYVLTHPERSMQVLDRKMGNIAAANAEVVATGNPGCLMQLGLGVKRHGLKVRIAHPVELLAEAYGASS
ncbi:MAG TPA: (Fe-S)-binding protein, partial [Dehalococcoidia bacterium]|nr:(Fe-S)-binding protein [Dehalococcoidia bacterium]